MATKVRIKQLSQTEKASRVVPAREKGDFIARREGLEKATNKVRTKASIDFVRSVRGR